uniref:Putative anion transporter 2, chloroplastic n=1 Tax=Aegilops tauschii TaxID=37682 RepID=N1QYE2_AEGTA
MPLAHADRAVMPVAVVPLAAQHGWSSSFVGIVQSSFLWGYVFSSMVGGALADRYGGKKVMAEGVAFPTMSTFLPKWFPTHERATAVGLSMGGFHLGNVVSFLATPIIMSHIGLAGTFAFFASLGYLWLSVWLLNVESDPIDSRTISKSELQLILAGRSKSKVKGSKSPSLREVFSKMEMWAIIVANVINNWGYFVLLSWMPVYFKTVYNVNLKQAAWFSAIPWGVMALSGYVAGASADFMIKSGLSIVRVRKIMQSIGFIGPGVSLLCLRFAQTPSAAAVIMTAALGLSSCSQAGYFCNVQLVKCLSAPTAQSKETNRIKIDWLAHSYKTERNHGGFVSVEKVGNVEISSTKLSLSFSNEFNIGVARTGGCGPLQNAKDKDWQKLKALHLYFSDPRSH